MTTRKNWENTNSFHNLDFLDFNKLIAKKKVLNYSIAFIIPTLNEEKTIGKIVSILINEKTAGLIDEVIVIDSESQDDTVNIAKNNGADVFLASEIKTGKKSYIGKGENMWKSLFVSKSDIICWVDGDIIDFTNRFVYGLIGPLLFNDKIKFIKSTYKRPLLDNKREIKDGGGRLTELLIKPLLKLYFSNLLYFNQPLSGEYGGFREIFDNLNFPIGYGVEISLLIDIYMKNGILSMAQVNMGQRKHRNRKLQDLSEMADEILPIFFNRCEKYNVNIYGKNNILKNIKIRDNL